MKGMVTPCPAGISPVGASRLGMEERRGMNAGVVELGSMGSRVGPWVWTMPQSRAGDGVSCSGSPVQSRPAGRGWMCRTKQRPLVGNRDHMLGGGTRMGSLVGTQAHLQHETCIQLLLQRVLACTMSCAACTLVHVIPCAVYIMHCALCAFPCAPYVWAYAIPRAVCAMVCYPICTPMRVMCVLVRAILCAHWYL